jgi:hypothetical protein
MKIITGFGDPGTPVGTEAAGAGSIAADLKT